MHTSPTPLRVEPGHSTPQTADTRPRRLRQQLARTWTLPGASARPSLLVTIYSSLAQNVKAGTAGPGSPHLAPRPCSEASLLQGKTAAHLKAARKDNKENSCLQATNLGEIHLKGRYTLNGMSMLPSPQGVRGREWAPALSGRPFTPSLAGRRRRGWLVLN